MSEKLYYEVIVKDKHGRVIVRQKRKAHSYLVAYSQLMYIGTNGPPAGSQNIVNTDGVTRNATANYYTFSMIALAGDTDYGIRVGSGNTPVDISDYALDTPVAEGVGAGQLSHLISVITNPTVAAGEAAFTVARVMVNGSGGTITVRNIGIYSQTGNIFPERYCCIVRDVLPGEVLIPDGGSITVTYTVKVVV